MSISAIHQRILDRIDNKFDKSDGGFTYDITKAPAIVLNNITSEIEKIIDKIDVEKLSGDELTQFVYQRTGIRRKEATFATDEVLVKGTPQANLTGGTLIAADDVLYEIPKLQLQVEHFFQKHPRGSFVFCSSVGIGRSTCVG